MQLTKRVVLVNNLSSARIILTDGHELFFVDNQRLTGAIPVVKWFCSTIQKTARTIELNISQPELIVSSDNKTIK